jgi:hypothetical protein
MEFSSDLIPTLLGQAQFPSFSPNVEMLQSCEDEEETHRLLIRAMEDEPFLLAKFVNRANSVAFGAPGEYFFSPLDCLTRVGLVEGLHTALDFYLSDALGPYIRANRHCVATWVEARVAAQLSKHFSDLCSGDFRTGAAFLTIALSYVGELFALSAATTSETTGINLGLYAQPVPGQIDVFHLSSVIIGKLQLPRTVTRTFAEVSALMDTSRFAPNPASVVLARALAQSSQPQNTPVSQVSLEMLESVVKGLQLDENRLAALASSALQSRTRVID